MGNFAKSLLIAVLVLCLAHIPEVASAAAADQMIPTQAVVDSLSRADLEAKVQSYLDRADLQKELKKLGVAPEEVSKRVASLSDVELKQLANQMDQARYGGDVVGILIVVLVVLMIIFFAKRV